MFNNNNGNSNNTGSGRDFERAVDFINISVINADNSEIKMPKGIPLRMSNKVERGLFEFLQANPDAVQYEQRMASGLAAHSRVSFDL